MKKLYKIITAVIITAVIFNLSVIPCLAVENSTTEKVIRVGWYDTEDTNAYNYDYEYLQALSQYTGWSYEYVNGTWEDCLTWLETGKIDILGFVHKTPEREKIYGFPNLPMANTNGYLVTATNSKLQSTDVKSLNGITVGIVDGNAYNADFVQYCTLNKINVKYKKFHSINDIDPAFKSGKIDAAVVAEEDKTGFESVLVKLVSHNQYFATDIDNQELLQELDAAMVSVNSYCPYLNSDLYQKYFSTNSDGMPIFTSAELAFIKSHKNILVMYDSGWPPIEYLDESTGEYKGISPDIFKLLSQKCGINFVYEGSTSGNVLTELKEGDQKNSITTISYDYTWADQHDVYITQPFITSTIVKLGKNLDTLNPTVAINEKAYFTYAMAKELKGVKTLNFKTQEERLEAVRTGKADYTYVTEDQANYYRSIPKYENLKIERMLGYEQKICVSVQKNSDPELMSIISKSIASISHDELTGIVMQNTVNSYKWTIEDFLFAYRVQIIITVLLLVIVVVSLALLAASRRRNSAKLEKAYEQKKDALLLAEQASAAKGSFMSRMSHEIRTPLNALIGYNTIAKDGFNDHQTDAERKQAEMKVMDCLTKSEIASKHLLTIINDVLDMSAIESGKIKLANDRFDFKGLITSLTTIFYTQAKTKGIDFEVFVGTLTEEWFVGDQLRVNQVLTNLLSNAVKFTPEGGKVLLKITQPDADNEASHIHFEVSDTGIGMSEEYLNRIWEPFEQADSTISRRFGGTGLGMTITKNLVDLMDGKISVESKQGLGTTFRIDLTFGRTEQPAENLNYDFSGINALVVDDDASTCDYIKLLFNRCGVRCATVNSGIEAIEAYIRAEKQNDKFTVCLVDWHMPKMDGIETIKKLRSVADNNLPIIVITAYDYSEVSDEAARAGVNMFIAKPLFQSSIFNFLVNITGKQAAKSVESKEKFDFNGTKIMLVEDNEMNMEIAKNFLETAGLTVDEAHDGKEALDMFTLSESGTYKAILMDVQMPVMDGHEATREIRNSNHPDAKSIPIIAMTADAFAENVAEALASGMNDHISKPINVELLMEKLSEYIV